jgi:hypothetical protein
LEPTRNHRWVPTALGIALIVALVITAVYVRAVVGDATDRQKNIEAVVVGQAAIAARDDCRAMIAAARRDVFDQLNLLLDVDRTLHDQLLGDALIGSVRGERSTQADIDAYTANNGDLSSDRALADELIPKLATVDHLVQRGGELPVVRSDRTVGTIRFDACPEVKP